MEVSDPRTSKRQARFCLPSVDDSRLYATVLDLINAYMCGGGDCAILHGLLVVQSRIVLAMLVMLVLSCLSCCHGISRFVAAFSICSFVGL